MFRSFKGGNKYKNKKIEWDGIKFDSLGECQRYQELLLLESAKAISELKRQVTFPFIVNKQKICSYRPDFTYIEKGRKVAEDFKGFETPEFKIKKKLFLALYQDWELRITTARKLERKHVKKS